jgi:hypothetical protein
MLSASFGGICVTVCPPTIRISVGKFGSSSTSSTSHVILLVSLLRLTVVNTRRMHQQTRSERRRLEANGCRVLRFWNNYVLGNIDGVLEVIQRAMSDHPHP